MIARRLPVAVAALAASLLGSSVSAMGLARVPRLEASPTKAARPAPLDDRPPTVRLAWCDPSDAAPGLLGAVTEETEAIFASMGLSTTWRGAGELDLMLEEEVTVILVPHTSPNPERRGRTVLGATPLGAQVHRKVWVHAPDVLRATGTSVRFRPGSLTPRDEARFVRALARVIVHEVIHALSPDLPHGEGVMSECLTRKLLTSGPLLIAAEVRAAVHAALDRNGSRRRGAGASKPAVVAGSGAGDGASSDISHQ